MLWRKGQLQHSRKGGPPEAKQTQQKLFCALKRLKWNEGKEFRYAKSCKIRMLESSLIDFMKSPKMVTEA